MKPIITICSISAGPNLLPLRATIEQFELDFKNTLSKFSNPLIFNRDIGREIPSDEHWVAEMYENDGLTLLARLEEDGPIVGILEAFIDPQYERTCSIKMVYVSEKYRGKRIASTLMDTALTYYKKYFKCKFVTSNVQIQNRAADKMLRKLKFYSTAQSLIKNI